MDIFSKNKYTIILIWSLINIIFFYFYFRNILNFLHNNLLSNFSYKKYKPFDLYGKIFIHKVQKSIIILLTIKSQIEHVNDRIIPIINAIMPIPNV